MVATTAVALVCVAFARRHRMPITVLVLPDGIADESVFASYIDEAKLDGDDLVDFDEQATLMGEIMRITLISNDGTVLFDNDVADVSMLESHAGRRVRSGEIDGESSA